MALDGRVALITGAARGIGTAITQHLSDADAKIAIADLDGDGAKAMAKTLKTPAMKSQRPSENLELTRFGGVFRAWVSSLF